MLIGTTVFCDAKVECGSEILEDPAELKQVCLKYLNKHGFKVIKDQILFYKFKLLQHCKISGVTGICILEASHFEISTWPEHMHVGMEIFVCDPLLDPIVFINSLLKELKVQELKLQKFERTTF